LLGELLGGGQESAVLERAQAERIRKKSVLPYDSQVVQLLRRHRSLEDVVHSGSQEELREPLYGHAGGLGANDDDDDYDFALPPDDPIGGRKFS
jgi:hypothetical protein